MNCDNCKKEDQWLEVIGSNFICAKCIQKHKELGFIYRTKINVFRTIIKEFKPKDFEVYMNITRKQIEEKFNLKSNGIILKTTNVVEI